MFLKKKTQTNKLKDNSVFQQKQSFDKAKSEFISSTLLSVSS